MSEELRDLYQQVILDHNRSPRNWGAVEAPDRAAQGHNPLCGDKLSVTVKLDGGRVADLRFQGSGCAISKSSASLMTESVKGRSLEEAESLYRRFHDLLTGPPDVRADAEDLGKLAVFAGVREFPARVKCATLAWHTLHSALEGHGGVAKTE